MTAWPHYQDTLACVHCGLCLPACPTYDVLGLEPDSPRGRILLARALAEDRIEDPAPVRQHLDQCLDCRACESICPSGVRYGQILEQARSTMAERFPVRDRRARLRGFLLSKVVARQGRLRLAFTLGRAAEVLGLRRLGEAIGLVPKATRDLLPRIPPAAARRSLAGVHEPEGTPRGTVALFTGCVMEQVFGELNRKTLTLLLANGFRVEVREQAGCCGRPVDARWPTRRGEAARRGQHRGAVGGRRGDPQRRGLRRGDARVRGAVRNRWGAGARRPQRRRLRLPRRAGPDRDAGTLPPPRRLRRPLPPVPRPGRAGRAPAAVGAGAGAGAGTEPPRGTLLRLRRHLQPQPAGAGQRDRGGQGRGADRDGRGGRRHRQPGLPDADPRRTSAGRATGCGSSTRWSCCCREAEPRTGRLALGPDQPGRPTASAAAGC